MAPYLLSSCFGGSIWVLACHQNNWREDMVPYSKYSDLEDTSKIINERFDKKNKKMLTHAEKVV
jgi:hypothetical protein